jgi:hypothetical protein
MNRLLDHRRFAAATAGVVAAFDLVLMAAAVALGRAGELVPGFAIGGGLALGDILMLSRSLDRLSSRTGDVGSRAVTVMLMGRFASISVLIGIAACARGISAVAVFAGFLLLPLAIAVVGAVSLRQSDGAAPGSLNGAAG